MNMINARELLNRADDLKSYTAEILSRLVSIRSLSGAEREIVLFLREEFTRCGADSVEIDRFGNIVARIGSGKPIIAFDAHLDTVDIGESSLWSFDPFGGKIGDGKVWGRGASDQKGGMAAMLTGLRLLSAMKDRLRATVYMVGSVLEEDCDGLCWRFLIDKSGLRPDFVVLTEPTDGNINRGQRGRMEIEVIVRGLSCHGSAPERGDSAIYKIAPIIEALRRLNDRLPEDPFLGKGTIALSRLRSSSPSLCAVADMAAVYIDRRLTAGETPEFAAEQIAKLDEVEAASAEVVIPEFDGASWNDYRLPVSKVFPAWVLSEKHPLAERACRCFAMLFEKKPKLGKWTFSTNGVATMGMFGIPTIGYGPGRESLAHAPNEFVEIDDLVKCSAFYAVLPWLLV